MTIIKSPKELESEIIRRMSTNRKRGLDVPWNNLNDLMSWKKGYPIFIAGVGGVGKTEFLSELVLSGMIMHGFKVCWLSPEMGTPVEIQEQLIEKLARGGVLESGRDNSLNHETVVKITNWLHKYVRIIDPTDGWKETMDGMTMNIENLFKQIKEEEKQLNAKFDIIVIDPFNELDWDTSNIMTAVKGEIDALLWWAKKHDYIPILCNHANDVKQLAYKSESDGKTYMVTPPVKKEQWAYGSQWGRKGYQMILVYEPHEAVVRDLAMNGDHECQHSKEHYFNMREIYIQKSKPKGVGKTGKVRMFYDAQTQRYYAYDIAAGKQGILYPKGL